MSMFFDAVYGAAATMGMFDISINLWTVKALVSLYEVNMAADGRKVKLIKSLLFSDRELDDKKCVRWWVSVKNSV